MSQERISNNFESKPQLFETILGEEKNEVSPEYLEMWSAENNACFPYFINFIKDEMGVLLSQAESGDKDAISHLNSSYQEYRSNLEADMADFAPLIYELFIGAVGRGDSVNASLHIEEYIKLVTGEQAEEDDDD